MKMSMTGGNKPLSRLVLAAMLVSAGVSLVWAAASSDEFKAAFASAEAADRQAGALRNRWTPTVSALAEAKKAADAGNFDSAVALAKEAEALAKASIFQAASEKDAWKALEIR